MPNSYVIDIRHYLDEKGGLAKMPDPAKRLAVYFGSIVAWVSRCPEPEAALTNVVCRRSRARPPCYGEVYARLTAGDAILFRCSACGEEGTISGWRETRWDWSAG
jgi:hypothetical protein